MNIAQAKQIIKDYRNKIKKCTNKELKDAVIILAHDKPEFSELVIQLLTNR